MTLQDEIKKAYVAIKSRDDADSELLISLGNARDIPGNFTLGYISREPEIASLREKIAELEECNVWQDVPDTCTVADIMYTQNGHLIRARKCSRTLPKTPIERVAEANGLDPVALAKAVKELEEAGK